MLFRRIAVRNFRKLLAPVVVTGLEGGVTILAGDNEEGKSTLLQAIRTGLFERHNLGGKAVEAMQPFGSAVRPEIRLDFEIDGKPYAITKGFALRASASLVTPDGTVEGPAAEEKLGELLTFRVPQRGESKPDDRGVLGLFWLEQGHLLDGLGFGEIGRTTLRSSLEGEVGNVLGGSRGRRLLDSAKTKRDQLLTATGRPRGDFDDAIKERDQFSTDVKALEIQRQEYDDEIDQLGQARRAIEQIKTDRVLETAQTDLQLAQTQAKEIEELRARNTKADQGAQLCKAQFEVYEGRFTRRKALIDASVGKASTKQETETKLEVLGRYTVEIEQRQAAAALALKQAEEAREHSEKRVSAAHARQRRDALEKELRDLRRRIGEADELISQRATAQHILANIKIDRGAFDNIQALERRIREERAALGAVATRVHFTPDAAQSVQIDGKEIDVKQPIEVTEATKFSLQGFGTVGVVPGASELVERQARLQNAEDELRLALVAVSVVDVAAAGEMLSERSSAETALAEIKRLLSAHAPDGLEVLKTELTANSHEAERLDAVLAVPDLANITDLSSETRSLVSAKSAEASARAELEAAQRNNRQHDQELAVARQACTLSEDALGVANRELERARSEVSDVELLAHLDTARVAVTVSLEESAAAHRALAVANPEEVDLRRKRAEAAVKSIELEERGLRERVIALESRLTAAGRNGIGEILEETRGREEVAIARLDRYQRDAQAWDLLVKTLTEAERSAKEVFLEPVLRRVDPFLRLLFPDTQISLDEDTLEITRVARGGTSEPYETLSVGTKEQLSILVRLAFAVYLREKGYPAAVILDDALVYADDDRFDRMQLALRKAAETVQILILTCRPRDWRAFGAPIVRLKESKGGGVFPA